MASRFSKLIFGFLAAALTFTLGTTLAPRTSQIEIAKPALVEIGESVPKPYVLFDPLNSSGETEPIKEDDFGCWDEETPTYGPIHIATNRILTTKCGTIFVKDGSRRLIWRLNTGAPLSDCPLLIGSTLVVVGFDLHLWGLNAVTGEKEWQFLLNGRSSLVQIVRFKDDRYFVVVNMAAYDDKYQICGDRDGSFSSCHRSTNDALWLCRKDEVLEEWKIPSDSKLKLSNKRIVVVSPRRSIEIRPK